MTTKTKITKAEINKFTKEIKQQSNLLKKLFRPTIHYDKDYDMLYISFSGHGRLKIESTNETTTEQCLPIRFDFMKGGSIVGVEIENASKIWSNKNETKK